MNNEKLQTVFAELDAHVAETMKVKGADYGSGRGYDRLGNLGRMGTILGTSPERANTGAMVKHIESVLEIVNQIENGATPDMAVVREKIGDNIGYLKLLYAQIFDRLAKDKKRKVQLLARVWHMCWVSYQMGAGQPFNITPTEAQMHSILNGVMANLDAPDMTPEQRHENWLKHKKAQGWKYGPKKDEAKKTHPCIRPYKQLPKVEQNKDANTEYAQLAGLNLLTFINNNFSR
jgi:hypothetical protein